MSGPSEEIRNGSGLGEMVLGGVVMGAGVLVGANTINHIIDGPLQMSSTSGGASGSGASGPTRTQPSMAPDPARKPRGTPEAATDWGKVKQNESAEIMSQAGYDVEYQPKITADELKLNPSLNPKANPDFRIEGKIFDGLATSSSRALNVYTKRP